MNTRQLWQQIMHYGEFDRLPVIHWTGWAETLERWHDEGMPRDVAAHAYFNAVPNWAWVGANLEQFPAFEVQVIEETDEYTIIRGTDGVIGKDWKHRSCIPHYIDFTLKTADDWPGYKKRLQPDPARLPEDLAGSILAAEESQLPIAVGTASMMGWIRNWMGVENMSYLMHDDPDVYCDMVMTLAELTCWSLDLIVPKMRSMGITPDMGFGWEDICGKTGPLVSPTIFERCVAQGYRLIRQKLDSYGIDLFGLDSDGMVEPLVPNWMQAGVNVMFPVEPGTWEGTPEHLRRLFGKELRMIGGFDKLALEKGRDAIDAELEAHVDLMKEGGYFLMPDHFITPGTPLEDYQYYLARLRELRF